MAPTAANSTGPTSDIDFMEYIGYNIVIPTVSACGVLGNILNLLVLTRGQMKAPIYIYFTTLAVADLITCLLVFFSGIAKGAAAASFWWQVFEVYIYLGIGSISTTVSIATIVMVTVERLILIRNGQRAKTYCTREMAWRVCLVILPVSIVFNIPYFMAFVVDDGIQETSFYKGQSFPAAHLDLLWAVPLRHRHGAVGAELIPSPAFHPVAVSAQLAATRHPPPAATRHPPSAASAQW